jgi:acyl-CoA dehydrogenase
MPINLEIPKKFQTLVTQANYAASEVYRANSRKYDLAEHTYPKELDMLAALLDGMAESGALAGAGADGSRASSENGSDDAATTRNGSNIASVLGIIEMC